MTTQTRALESDVLVCDNVRKTFDENVVLDDVSLQLPQHSVSVIIGASGSGKSTMLRCINLLERIDDGQIFLAGADITEIGVAPDAVRRRIGTVFQQFNLFPHMNVLANITLAPIKVHGVAPERAREDAMALLKRFGLAEKAGAYPDRLSGGQQQRVAILRAIATKPLLLLLDEVTSALDPLLVAEVLALVEDLRQDGVSMVIATHEMGFARHVADDLMFLYQGRVVEQGDPNQLLDDPKTPELQHYLSQMRAAGRL
jgi:polar amino acid transport system ATP-binding protein